MDTSPHNLAMLFAQLGLNNSKEGIEKFTCEHNIDTDLTIDEASFWTESQAKFLKEAIDEDGDWSEVVDQLDIMLRTPSF